MPFLGLQHLDNHIQRRQPVLVFLVLMLGIVFVGFLEVLQGFSGFPLPHIQGAEAQLGRGHPKGVAGLRGIVDSGLVALYGLRVIAFICPDVAEIVPENGTAGLPAVAVEYLPGPGIIIHGLRKGVDFIIEVADIPVQAGGGIVDLFLGIALRRIRSGLPGRHPVEIAQRKPIINDGAVVPLLIVIQLTHELRRQIGLIEGM